MTLSDARKLSDLTLVGENRTMGKPRPVYATTSVAEFATEVLKTCWGKWGVPLGKGGWILKGELADLFLMEENKYITNASIRFRLEDQSGKRLWEGIAAGNADQWWHSFEEDTYREGISDALQMAYANILSNPGLQKALGGEAPQGQELAVNDLKAKILKMMAEGIGADVIAGYVKSVKLSAPLTAEQIVEWKKAGIAEAVLNAAVSR